MTNKNENLAEKIADTCTYDQEVAEAYLELGITGSTDPIDIAREIDECYQGSYNGDADFAQQICEDIGDIPKDFPTYIHIDWERTANDIMMDYSEENGHYFRNV